MPRSPDRINKESVSKVTQNRIESKSRVERQTVVSAHIQKQDSFEQLLN